MNFVNKNDAISKGAIFPSSDFGVKIGFTSDKFDGYLWIEDNYILISAILSLDEHKGHLIDLFNNITKLGYGIKIFHPGKRMKFICLKYGFIDKNNTLIYINHV